MASQIQPSILMYEISTIPCQCPFHRLVNWNSMCSINQARKFGEKSCIWQKMHRFKIWRKIRRINVGFIISMKRSHLAGNKIGTQCPGHEMRNISLLCAFPRNFHASIKNGVKLYGYKKIKMILLWHVFMASYKTIWMGRFINLYRSFSLIQKEP